MLPSLFSQSNNQDPAPTDPPIKRSKPLNYIIRRPSFVRENTKRTRPHRSSWVSIQTLAIPFSSPLSLAPPPPLFRFARSTPSSSSVFHHLLDRWSCVGFRQIRVADASLARPYSRRRANDSTGASPRPHPRRGGAGRRGWRRRREPSLRRRPWQRRKRGSRGRRRRRSSPRSSRRNAPAAARSRWTARTAPTSRPSRIPLQSLTRWDVPAMFHLLALRGFRAHYPDANPFQWDNFKLIYLYG
jgi:hypothetical protein